MQYLSRISRGLVLLLLRFYRFALSPLKPRCCRFTPTCSEYAITAFCRFGFFKAMLLTGWRLLRCHPFYRGALYEPVPELSKKRVCSKIRTQPDTVQAQLTSQT